MKASKELISDLARSALNGDRQSFLRLMEILETVRHPITLDIDRRFSGAAIVDAVLAPLATLVLGFPKPVVHSQVLVWNGPDGRPDNGPLPAEIWFRDESISYFKNGQRHRDGENPTVVDVANKTIAYYRHGVPRGHSKGPFKVEHDNGHVMLTYVMEDRMATREQGAKVSLARFLARPLKPGASGPEEPSNKWISRSEKYDVESDPFEEPVEGGDHVIVTRDYIDIEGLGKSAPSNEDLQNLGIWRKELIQQLSWGSSFIVDYMRKFK